MKILLLFFGFLTSFHVVAHTTRKPDVAASAIQSGGSQATTLLTSVINNADIVLHDVSTYNDQNELVANTDDLVDVDDAEVLTDTEQEDDDELDEVIEANSEESAVGNTANSQAGKGTRARLLRFKQIDCEKKRGVGKGKKMKEGKCHTLHKNHFQSYQFSVGDKKSKKKTKNDEDDDSDDSTSKTCRIIVYHDGKCKEEASTANEGSCEDMEDAEDDDDEEKKLRSRDLTGKPKGGKYRSAKFLCDGVDASTNSSSTKTVSDYYTVSSDHYSVTSKYRSATSDYYSETPEPSTHVGANATALSSKSFASASINSTLSSHPPTRSPSKTLSRESATTGPPDEDDKEDPEEDDHKEEPEEDDKEVLDEKDEEDEPDDEDHRSNLPETQTTKTKMYKSRSHKKTKGTKKHPKQTQNTVTPTPPVKIVTSA